MMCPSNTKRGIVWLKDDFNLSIFLKLKIVPGSKLWLVWTRFVAILSSLRLQEGDYVVFKHKHI